MIAYGRWSLTRTRGGCINYEGLTLPFLRSTFTSTLNHSSMELVLNTQIAKKLLFQTNLNKIQLFPAQSF